MQKAINKLSLLYLLILLPVNPVKGQTGILKEISDKLLNYCREIPREEVFIHTDRSEYIAGEELWFSAYLFDRQTGNPVDNGSIIYIELLNSENRRVQQKRVEVYNGPGIGEILLPDTLGTGCYTIRAYTRWMKTFLPYNCYMQKIRVYNAFSNGGYITCQNKNEQFVSRSDISIHNSNKSAALFNVNIDSNKTDNINFTIETSDEFRSSNNANCYIFIETHGIIEHTGAVKLNAPKSLYSVPVKSLTGGISHITFFNEKGVPVSERYIYIKGKDKELLTISAPDSCRKREKVIIEITSGGDVPLKADNASISLSVTPQTGIPSAQIDNYMVFGSEFGNLPDNIEGKNPADLPVSLLDSFLITAKSNWIDWNIILSGKFPLTVESPEKESHFLSGRLISRNSHQPISNKYMILSAPGKKAAFQYSITDTNGLFRFTIPENEVDQDLVIQPWENDKGNTIEILSSFDEENLTNLAGSYRLDKNVPEHIARWSTNYQVNRIYGIRYSVSSENQTRPLPERKRFYGKPDIELVLDDYIKLPVMQEVFFELLPGISLKSRKSVYDITMIDTYTKTWQKTHPTLFIDGVIVNDATVIANLDPEIVERIDVITDKYFVGNFVFYGLLNVITRAADFSCATLPEQAVRLRYNLADPEASFKEPEFSDQDKGMNNIPDFRNTLYWNPLIKPGSNGKFSVNFRAADLAGEYEINIQGLTSDGKPLSGKKLIKIYQP